MGWALVGSQAWNGSQRAFVGSPKERFPHEAAPERALFGWNTIVPREKWNLQTPRLPYYEYEHSSGGPNARNRTRVVPPGLRTLFHTGSLTGLTDGQLVERYALQDREEAELAFATLVARHGSMVWSTCRAVVRDDHDAGDAFQAAFLVLMRTARSLWVRDSLGPWLHRVAFRAAIQAKRDANRRKEAEQRVAELTVGWTDCAMPDDLADIIHQEIDRLPAQHRIPLVLCVLEERFHEEAARHLMCPVGTVKSRLARARVRLRAALCRRGVGPAAVQPALITNLMVSVSSPPQVLTESTIRSAVVFATDPIQATNAVSKTALILAEGVLSVMIRSKLQSAILGTVAALGLLIMAWLAHAGQAVVERPKALAPAAAPNSAMPIADLQGNWIVTGYPSGDAIGLIKIDGPSPRAHANLLSIGGIGGKDIQNLAESKVDHLRIDEQTVRFTLQLKFKDTPMAPLAAWSLEKGVRNRLSLSVPDPFDLSDICGYA
jgi:RNA polymerase sigma factor (sigma-70 family)